MAEATRREAARASLATGRRALRREMPPRYAPELDLRPKFDAMVVPLVRSAGDVLDVGSGRMPTFGLEDRNPSGTYVGLDLDAAELDAAPPGSYDRAIASDATTFVPELEGQFDLIISWQVLEHVKDLDAAIENLRRYLRPGGQLVAQFSGTFGLFSLLSRAVPQRVTPWLLERLYRRPRTTTFPAYYHHCWATALERAGASWSTFEVLPRHEGAGYFRFSRFVQAGYLAYEEWAEQRGHDNLASYYVIVGQR